MEYVSRVLVCLSVLTRTVYQELISLCSILFHEAATSRAVREETLFSSFVSYPITFMWLAKLACILTGQFLRDRQVDIKV